MSTVAFLFAVASTHLLLGERTDIYHSGLIFSTDDSTVFVFRGIAKEKSRRFLLQDGNDPNTTNQSVYGNEEGGNDHLNCLRVRLTFTINDAGMLAATFITVTGLTERELPKEGCLPGVLRVSIKGLCAGGAQDLRHDAVGYISFYRKEKCAATQITVEQWNFTFYRLEILIPFIGLVRQKLYGHVEGEHIPESLTAVSWTDGAAVQLNVIVGERQQAIDKQLKIVSNKHNASRTAVEQPCDLSLCFMSFRKLANGTTRDDVPAVVLQLKVKNNFAELKVAGTLDLGEKKESALVDFLGTYPSIVSRACSTESVARGFLLNGMVDKSSLLSRTSPRLFNLVRTKRGWLPIRT